LVEQYCGSFRAVPRRIVLDIDDTFDRVHRGQQLRLFNAHYDDYGFQPIVVFGAWLPSRSARPRGLLASWRSAAWRRAPSCVVSAGRHQGYSRNSAPVASIDGC
jgi:hypothetical protein